MFKGLTIVCPACKHKQTGFVKIAGSSLKLIPSSEHGKSEEPIVKVSPGDPDIRCAWIPCQHLIIGDELDDVLSPVVQFPSDLIHHLNR